MFVIGFIITICTVYCTYSAIIVSLTSMNTTFRYSMHQKRSAKPLRNYMHSTYTLQQITHTCTKYGSTDAGICIISVLILLELVSIGIEYIIN